MKKRHITVAIVLAIASSLTLSSCIGSFALTNKLLGWNRQVGSKFVNELVFVAFCIIPVYEIAALADVLVINSIEFWSGNNPMAVGTRVIQGENDRYLVECDGHGYTITGEKDKTPVRLEFKDEDKSWSVIDANGVSHTIFSYVDDTHISIVTPEGDFRTFELSDEGLYAYRALANSPLWAAK